MKKIFILTILPLILLLANCNKTTKPYTPLDPVFKSSYGFKVGSYWIYREHLTGIIDSCYVYQSNDYNESYGNGSHELLNYSIKIVNINVANIEEWQFGMGGPSLSVSFSDNKDSIENKLGLYIFNYSVNVGQSSNIGTGTYYKNSNIDYINSTYNLNGVIYKEVAQIHEWADSSAMVPHPSIRYSDYFYVSPSVGIIKIIFNHPQDSVNRELDLLRYKTITY